MIKKLICTCRTSSLCTIQYFSLIDTFRENRSKFLVATKFVFVNVLEFVQWHEISDILCLFLTSNKENKHSLHVGAL